MDEHSVFIGFPDSCLDRIPSPSSSTRQCATVQCVTIQIRILFGAWCPETVESGESSLVHSCCSTQCISMLFTCYSLVPNKLTRSIENSRDKVLHVWFARDKGANYGFCEIASQEETVVKLVKYIFHIFPWCSNT